MIRKHLLENFAKTPEKANEHVLNRNMHMDTDNFYHGVAEQVYVPGLDTRLDFLVRAGPLAVASVLNYDFLWDLDALPDQSWALGRSPLAISRAGYELLQRGVIFTGEDGKDTWVKPSADIVLDVPLNRIIGVTVDDGSVPPEGTQPIRLHRADPAAAYIEQ